MKILDQNRLIQDYFEYTANLKDRRLKLIKDEEKLERILIEEIKTVENKKIAQERFQKIIDRNKEDAIKLFDRRMDFLKSSLNII